jgi:hypothetical protein
MSDLYSYTKTAEFWLTNIDRLNGRKWWPRKIGLQVRIDVSNVGFGGNFQLDSVRPSSALCWDFLCRRSSRRRPARNKRCGATNAAVLTVALQCSVNSRILGAAAKSGFASDGDHQGSSRPYFDPISILDELWSLVLGMVTCFYKPLATLSHRAMLR